MTSQTIGPSLTPEIIEADIIEPLLQLAVDPIPNIRFNVARALEMVGGSFGTEGRTLAQQRIVPALEQQKTDSDADVRYYSARALQKTVAYLQGEGSSNLIRGSLD